MAQAAFDVSQSEMMHLPSLIDLVAGATVSKPLIETQQIKQVLFAMDAGQRLSEHSSSYPATVHVLDGQMMMTVGKVKHTIKVNDWLILPANALHGIDATHPVKFLLTLVKQSS